MDINESISFLVIAILLWLVFFWHIRIVACEKVIKFVKPMRYWPKPIAVLDKPQGDWPLSISVLDCIDHKQLDCIRIEVIDETSRKYTRWNAKVRFSVQDDNKTLKVFVSQTEED